MWGATERPKPERAGSQFYPWEVVDERLQTAWVHLVLVGVHVGNER